jgi:hypothetical protein
MRHARRFPFGNEPAPKAAAPTTPLPPHNPQATVPLVDFMPPARALPFRAPPLAPVPPIAPAPPLPPRVPARSPVSFRTAAAVVLLVLDVLVLVYLAATWRP